jgi:hypothetical protein
MIREFNDVVSLRYFLGTEVTSIIDGVFIFIKKIYKIHSLICTYQMNPNPMDIKGEHSSEDCSFFFFYFCIFEHTEVTLAWPRRIINSVRHC